MTIPAKMMIHRFLVTYKNKKDTGCKLPKEVMDVIRNALSQTTTQLESTEEFSDTTDAIYLDHISDRRLRGILVTVFQAIKAVKTSTLL
jgi:hypothetical protein